MKPEELRIIVKEHHIEGGEPMRAIARRLSIDYARVFRAKAHLTKKTPGKTTSLKSLTEWTQVYRTGHRGGRTAYHSNKECRALHASKPIPCNHGAMIAAGLKPCPHCFKP